MRVEVDFTDAVTVTGAPTLALQVGSVERQASYARGTGTKKLAFEYCEFSASLTEIFTVFDHHGSAVRGQPFPVAGARKEVIDQTTAT